DVPDGVVLTGHSGAGPLLPTIGATLPRSPAHYVFLDASLPPLGGESTLVPERFLGFLEPLAQDGRLPKWSDWWPPGTMETLVPDESKRQAIVAEFPELPLACLTEPVPVPERWNAVGVTYLLFSPPHEDDAHGARRRGHRG